MIKIKLIISKGKEIKITMKIIKVHPYKNILKMYMKNRNLKMKQKQKLKINLINQNIIRKKNPETKLQAIKKFKIKKQVRKTLKMH